MWIANSVCYMKYTWHMGEIEMELNHFTHRK